MSAKRRRVIDAFHLAPEEPGSYVCQLTCGHVVKRYSPKAAPKSATCSRCAAIANTTPKDEKWTC